MKKLSDGLHILSSEEQDDYYEELTSFALIDFPPSEDANGKNIEIDKW